MAIRVERFPIGKETNKRDLERFLLEQNLVPDDIVDISLSRLGQDALEYVLTYEDSGAPRVIQTVPNQGDPTVAPGTTITFIFNKPVTAITTADVEIENLTTSTILSDTLYTIDNSDIGDRKGVLRILDSPGYLVDANTAMIWRHISTSGRFTAASPALTSVKPSGMLRPCAPKKPF